MLQLRMNRRGQPLLQRKDMLRGSSQFRQVPFGITLPQSLIPDYLEPPPERRLHCRLQSFFPHTVAF